MENQITIREAVTENDVAAFWEQLRTPITSGIFSRIPTRKNWNTSSVRNITTK